MTATITMNGIDVVSMRLVTPMVGVWFADLDLDPAASPTPLAGPAAIAFASSGQGLAGFIDPKAQGSFGAKAACRVVGGANGWQSSVTPQHYHNDAGVLLSQVVAATAAEVLERATVIVDQPLGVDYVRAAGPASTVLQAADWHVDLTGTTIVGPRVPIPADPTAVDILDYDPAAQRAELAADGIVTPATILVDPRFGALTTVDVEQTWNERGARATAWCGGSSVSRIVGALAKFVEVKAGVAYLRIYRYRIVLQGPDGRLQLQPVDIAGPMPTTLPIDVWPGMSGVAAKYTLGTEVLVGFVGGNPAQPVVVGFSSVGMPLQLALNASAPGGVVVGEGVPPLSQAVLKAGTLAPPTGFAVWALAVEAALAAHGAIGPGLDWATLGPGIASTKLVTD